MKRLLIQLPFVFWSLVSVRTLSAPKHIGLDLHLVLVKYLHNSIAFHEGGRVRGTMLYAQNNPCALLFVSQKHAHRGMNGYAAFDTRIIGDAACDRDLAGKFELGLDVDEILELWNPGGNYAAALKRETGLTGQERFFVRD